MGGALRGVEQAVTGSVGSVADDDGQVLVVAVGVHTRCSRSPQKNRDWLAQCPYSAHPARSERLTVSRERVHSTGVESITHMSSVATLVSLPRAVINLDMVAASFRSRLSYPGWRGSVGNMTSRRARA